MRLTFHGGAKSVTGANYLLEVGGTKILIDCGLAQGGKFAEAKNFKPFAYDPHEVKAVFLTHAHLDHVGRLPKLRRDGFRGDIYATHPTLDLARIVLDDSLSIMREEAEKMGEPMLFSDQDLINCWKLTHGRNYHESVRVGGNIRVIFKDAGHILGSSIIEVYARDGETEKRIVFSGDLGNSPAPFLKPTEPIRQGADYVLVESTYGNRLHEGKDERRAKLIDVIATTVNRGGTLMIPAFAIERTQELLYELHRLLEQGKIPRLPVFLDSPMAIRATAVYQKYSDYLNKETKTHIDEAADEIFDFPGLEFTLTSVASKRINEIPPPKIIIAGSGMSNGGRILHHERRYLQDPKSTLLVIGWQAYGTLGRRLLDGATEIKIFGETVPVRAETRAIGGYSAHADQAGLLAWLKTADKPPTKIFVVQGEEEPANVLASKVKEELGFGAEVPSEGQVVEL